MPDPSLAAQLREFVEREGGRVVTEFTPTAIHIVPHSLLAESEDVLDHRVYSYEYLLDCKAVGTRLELQPYCIPTLAPKLFQENGGHKPEALVVALFRGAGRRVFDWEQLAKKAEAEALLKKFTDFVQTCRELTDCPTRDLLKLLVKNQGNAANVLEMFKQQATN